MSPQVAECSLNAARDVSSFVLICVFISASFLKLHRVSTNANVLGRCSVFAPVGHRTYGITRYI